MNQEEVKSLFVYIDGSLYSRVNRKSSRVGDIAGHSRADGYRIVGVNGKQEYEHRVIYLYHHGFIPPIVDHIDRDNTNNQIDNLRGLEKYQNLLNSKKCTAKSGIKGVYWVKGRNVWGPIIRINNQFKYLGTTKDFFEACCRRKAAEGKYLKDILIS